MSIIQNFKIPVVPEFRQEECSLCVDDCSEGLYYCTELNCWESFCRQHLPLHLTIHTTAVYLFLKKLIGEEVTAGDNSKSTTAEEHHVRKKANVEKMEYTGTWIKFKGADSLAIEQQQEVSLEWIQLFTQIRTEQQNNILGNDWNVPLQACEHTLMLQQQQPSSIDSINLHQCSQCGMKTNLWICLTCGNIGCGRKQFDGSGGNSHGFEHFQYNPTHFVACKLGTITSAGTADIYCYDCDDMRLDPDLALHMSTFGINLQGLVKTDKSMQELQLEHNLNYEFNMATADGKDLTPVYGPNLTGLKNIGNSCYINSSLQSLVTIPPIIDFKNVALSKLNRDAMLKPSKSLLCQSLKVVQSLISGDYSRPGEVVNDQAHLPVDLQEAIEKQQQQMSQSQEKKDNSVESGQVQWQDGIKLTAFKNLMAGNNAEFKTARQQDAFEYIQHLFTRLDQEYNRSRNVLPPSIFRPGLAIECHLNRRVQCTECLGCSFRDEMSSGIETPIPQRKQTIDGVEQYQDVKLSECIEQFFADEVIQDFRCTRCQKKINALSNVRLNNDGSKDKRLPPIIILHMQRFILENWVPKKLNLSILCDQEVFDIGDKLRSGPSAEDQLLPEDEITAGSNASASTSSNPQVDNTALEQLMSMGFTKNRSTRALLETGNGGSEVAMEWLFSRMDDPTLDDPLPPAIPVNAAQTQAKSTTKAPAVDPNSVNMVVEMGFSAAQAKAALKQTSGNVEAAVEWLFSNPDAPLQDDNDEVEQQQETSAASTSGSSSQYPDRFKNLGSKYRLHAVIAHKGSNVNSGHYVAYVRYKQPEGQLNSVTSTNDKPQKVVNDGEWVLFNDEKVVKYDKGVLYRDGDTVDKDVGSGYIYILVNENI
ncbi:hypothetical protein MIR68_011636 [Amoeboaphelidium protococcarum]|nr:hypothetical protein MIR68_011636 [Amoeboaphelidium protococcarum]